MRATAYLCDHPNWVNRRSPNCKRRTTKVCAACGVPTCSTHLWKRHTDTDGRLYCQRWVCRNRRAAEIKSREAANA